jgi:hypothetical protein
MNNKIYTGIGSRKTPEEILEIMRIIANKLYFKGYTLRSGGAPGADQAFEWGLAKADENRSLIQLRSEIYLPWASFEKENRSWIHPKLEKPGEGTYSIASHYHPAWNRLSNGGRTLHARNVHQILGENILKQVLPDFVICWTKDGKGCGGTGQALRIAKTNKIPIYDLAKEKSYDKIIDMIYR